MRHIVLSLLIAFTLGGLQAQSKKELNQSLQRDLEAYRKYTLAMNFDSSFQFMSPRMFDIVPFDTLKETILKSMDNEYLKVEMSGMEYTQPKKVKVKKAGEHYWALVPYTGSMKMMLKGDASFMSILLSMMKKEFGDENVKADGESTLLLTMTNKALIAFREPGVNKWYLLDDKRKDENKDSMQQLIYETVVPEEVRKALDK